MDNDDLPVGRILSRREILTLFGASGAAALIARGPQSSGTVPAAAAAAVSPASYLPLVLGPQATATPITATATPITLPACVVRPAVTEGPYFVDEKLNRSDIRSDPTTSTVKPGARLSLTFNVSQVASNACDPLVGATVDVWHCDAAGVYSDVADAGFNTVGQQFLRGYQVTDANGRVTFTTIYPGWYSGRAVHIHFKIRATTATNQSYEFTSQLFFDDTLSTQVFIQAPYASKGQRTTFNSNDNIYDSQLLLAVTSAAAGYTAAFDVGLQIG